MKAHPRIRKTVKWGGAVVCVVLIAAWVVSGWWILGWATRTTTTGVGHGGAIIGGDNSGPYSSPPGVIVIPIHSEGTMFWWTKWSHVAPHWELAIPLWMLLLPTLLVTTAAWRLDILARRRAMTGLCPKCRYDRAGLPTAAPCPECGAAAPVQITNT